MFHTDAVQAFGKVAIEPPRTVRSAHHSGHKIGAPKGTGALFVRRGPRSSPCSMAGAQERGRRSGTENVAFAVGLARAAELAVAEREEEVARLRVTARAARGCAPASGARAHRHRRVPACAAHRERVDSRDRQRSMLMALDSRESQPPPGPRVRVGRQRLRMC